MDGNVSLVGWDTVCEYITFEGNDIFLHTI